MCRRTAVLLSLILTFALSSATSPVLAQGDKKEEPQPTKFKVGDTAPDFTLKNQDGKDVKLSDYRGKKSVALAFYVFAFTGG